MQDETPKWNLHCIWNEVSKDYKLQPTVNLLKSIYQIMASDDDFARTVLAVEEKQSENKPIP